MKKKIPTITGPQRSNSCRKTLCECRWCKTIPNANKGLSTVTISLSNGLATGLRSPNETSTKIISPYKIIKLCSYNISTKHGSKITSFFYIVLHRTICPTAITPN